MLDKIFYVTTYTESLGGKDMFRAKVLPGMY